MLLEQHAFVVRNGKKEAFSETHLKLPEKVLEDIKSEKEKWKFFVEKRFFSSVRCCFVSPFARAKIFAKNKLNSTEKNESVEEAAPVEYTFGTETVIHIPGLVR